MKRAIIIMILVAMLSGAALGADGNETASPTPTPNATTTPSTTNGTYLTAIDNETRIVSAEWDDDELTLVVESDRSRSATITDASVEIDGVTHINRDRVLLVRGTTEITFSVDDGSEPAVTIAVGDSLVGIGEQDYSSDSSPFGATSSTMGWFGGASVVAVMLTLAVRKARKSNPDAPKDLKP